MKVKPRVAAGVFKNTNREVDFLQEHKNALKVPLLNRYRPKNFYLKGHSPEPVVTDRKSP